LAANADSSAVDGAGVSGPPINQDDSDDDRGHSPGGPSTPMSPDNDSQVSFYFWYYSWYGL
jgi:hypothetical protein